MNDYVFHLIRSLSTKPNMVLVAQFDDGTIKEYDVSQLKIRHCEFKEFDTDSSLFAKVKIDTGGFGVVWNETLDLSANEIWANGKTIENPFNGLMAFSDASRIWNLNESTLRKALSYGKLNAGVDCCKYGKQWVVTSEAMHREYGEPKKDYLINEDCSWNNLAVAEEAPPYSP